MLRNYHLPNPMDCDLADYLGDLTGELDRYHLLTSEMARIAGSADAGSRKALDVIEAQAHLLADQIGRTRDRVEAQAQSVFISAVRRSA